MTRSLNRVIRDLLHAIPVTLVAGVEGGDAGSDDRHGGDLDQGFGDFKANGVRMSVHHVLHEDDAKDAEESEAGYHADH